MLEPRAETVERVGAHRIIAAPAIGAERPIGDVAAKPLAELRAPGQRPIDAGGEKFGNDRFQPAGPPAIYQMVKPRSPVFEIASAIHALALALSAKRSAREGAS